jgi:hypothetical protein
VSILHVNQIAGALHRMFDGHIDLADASPLGNRYIAHMVFQRLPAAIVNASSPLPTDMEASVRRHVDEIYDELTTQANALYPQAYLAQLFKNQKLMEIASAIAAANVPAAASASA